MKENSRMDKNKRARRITREIIQVRAVTKVTKGGRQRHFSVLVLTKKQKSIGFGFANKGTDLAKTIRAATNQAEKNSITYFSETPRTIPHDLEHSFGATTIKLFPAPAGSGIIAGGALNPIFKYLGIQDVSAKIIGSSNPLNVVHCALQALKKIN
jgi:small subunit ribosomal protein S5